MRRYCCHAVRMATIVLGTDKGGTAKTTSAANLAAALAGGGASVCVLDCDPQGDLSALFGLDDYEGPRLTAWLRDPGTNAEPVRAPSGLAIIPGDLDQADEAAGLQRVEGGHLRLREVCDRLSETYDWLILDPPPGTAPMLTLAMFAADAAIVPAGTKDLDIRGATAFLSRIEDGEFDDDARTLALLGILLTQTNPRRVLRRQAHDALAGAGIPVIPHEIPLQERVSGHMRHGRPTVEIEPDGKIARAYRDLAAWLIDEQKKATA
ncbi:unannotated protein [freshwater metagenome]|uniref:Unannotated protein n=1 Tax=freshwater metagenome TaxID=449393 RepID=A0A6J7J7N6_9ZZZZ